MAVRVFHTDAGGYGVLSSIMAIGTISGALLGAGRDMPRFRYLLVGAAFFGLGCALAAIAPGYWLFAAALVLIGVAALTFMNTSNSLMQLSTEPAMRGRVMAIRLAIALGGTPIGAPIAGWVADRYGPRWSLGLAAVAGRLDAGDAARACGPTVNALIGTYARQLKRVRTVNRSQSEAEQPRLPREESATAEV